MFSLQNIWSIFIFYSTPLGDNKSAYCGCNLSNAMKLYTYKLINAFRASVLCLTFLFSSNGVRHKLDRIV